MQISIVDVATVVVLVILAVGLGGCLVAWGMSMGARAVFRTKYAPMGIPYADPAPSKGDGQPHSYVPGLSSILDPEPDEVPERAQDAAAAYAALGGASGELASAIAHVTGAADKARS
jgi:hypothetical protein